MSRSGGQNERRNCQTAGQSKNYMARICKSAESNSDANSVGEKKRRLPLVDISCRLRLCDAQQHNQFRVFREHWYDGVDTNASTWRGRGRGWQHVQLAIRYSHAMCPIPTGSSLQLQGHSFHCLSDMFATKTQGLIYACPWGKCIPYIVARIKWQPLHLHCHKYTNIQTRTHILSTNKLSE